MTTYGIATRVDEREYPEYVAIAKERMKREIGNELAKHIEIGAPTLVQIEEHEVPNYSLRCLEVGFRVEIVKCRQERMRPLEMDGFIVRMPRQIARAEPIFVDRPVIQRVEVEKIVEVDRPQPTFWQRVANHLKSMTAEVEYDGGYGEFES